MARRLGLWQESAGAAGLAGLRDVVDRGIDVREPVVIVATSSGFKNRDSRYADVPIVEPTWKSVVTTLSQEYRLHLE